MDEFDCPVNLNPEIICRICMESSKTPLNDLFVKEIVDGEVLALPLVFQQLFRIKIFRNDKLPQRICQECKEKLIESTKFKRKCENSNKVLHDVLQPGYDYALTSSSKSEEESPEVIKKDFSCQTDELEAVEVVHKVDERVAEEIFEDGMQYYKLRLKAERAYTEIGDEFVDLCQQFIGFDSKAENLCTFLGCEERITTVVALQSHLKEKHLAMFMEFLEKLESVEEQQTSETVNITEIQPQEQYTITENNEVVQMVEYEEDQFETEHEMKSVIEEEEDDTGLVELSNVSYHCPICHKLYQGPDEIEKHRNLHEIVLPTLFDKLEHYCCEVCKAVFTSIDQVRDHFILGHDTALKQGLDREYGSLPVIQNKLFVFKGQASDEDVTVEDNEERSFLEIYETEGMEYESPLICGVCHKSYNSVESIRYHTFSHLSSFKCPFECGTEFDFAFKLLQHLRYTHFKEKTDLQLICTYCKEQFDSKKECREHMNEICTKRIVSCHICTKKFVNQAGMKNHLKVHDQPQCVDCDKTFATTSDLRTHLRTSHAISDCNKIYKCGHCDKRFRTPSHRADHEESHNTENKYQCEICMNLFKSERVLKAHQKLHTVGRSHACPVCGKFFNRSYHVKLHMKTHNNLPKN